MITLIKTITGENIVQWELNNSAVGSIHCNNHFQNNLIF